MGLMDQIKNDVQQITGNLTEFAVVLSFDSRQGDTATISGIYSDHSNVYDLNGAPVTGKFTHVSISEAALTTLSYPTRNADGLADMKGHLVTITYADASTKQYIIDDVRPDYTINLFILILSDYDGVN